MGQRTKARECAFQILYQLDLTHEPFDKVLASFWQIRRAAPKVRERAEQLARDTLAQREEIDALIEKLSAHWRFERIAMIDLNILRLASFELMCEQATPAPVVIDEAVEMSKRFGEADTYVFVNGVLDAVRRAVRTSDADEQVNE
ncbi:MAG: transcription antitermination factor NusB [Vicinamibacteria bacterium]|nr:transcription antitermination factor NusB [Vicinamibacteria bacterium]